MKIFDLNKMQSFPYEERGKNVFYHTDEFKTRVINLSTGEKIPECVMSSYLIFYVIKGEATVAVNSKEEIISSGMCVISEPANISLRTRNGAKILGIQVRKL